MTKAEAIKDAEHYADTFGCTVYVLVRGNNYKSSQNKQLGWRVEEKLTPHTGLTARHPEEPRKYPISALDAEVYRFCQRCDEPFAESDLDKSNRCLNCRS